MGGCTLDLAFTKPYITGEGSPFFVFALSLIGRSGTVERGARWEAVSTCHRRSLTPCDACDDFFFEQRECNSQTDNSSIVWFYVNTHSNYKFDMIVVFKAKFSFNRDYDRVNNKVTTVSL